MSPEAKDLILKVKNYYYFINIIYTKKKYAYS